MPCIKNSSLFRISNRIHAKKPRPPETMTGSVALIAATQFSHFDNPSILREDGSFATHGYPCCALSQ